MKPLRYITQLAVPILALTISVSAHAAKEDNTDGVTTHFANFKRTPEAIITSGPGIFTYTGNTLHSLSGKDFIKKGKFLINTQANPFGTAFFIIANEGAKTSGGIYANNHDINELFSVNRKKFGNPLAVAYTKDGLRILLASDNGLYVLNAPDRAVLDTMPLPTQKITLFTVSDNGYYLALADGSKMWIVNLEDKSIRKEWDFEVRINDMVFNDSSTEFAVVTEDGTLSIFDTRTFLIKKTIDDLGQSLACSFNFDGKYIAVVTSPTEIAVINLLKTSDREIINVPNGGTYLMRFVPTSDGKPLLVYNSTNAMEVRKMFHLTPYFGRLVNDEANEMLNEWLKMMPGETMEQYRDRVNDESRERQRRLFEDEVSTRLAPDMLSMAAVNLGKYDRGNGVLEIDFSNMPSIFLPVPETDLAAFQGNDNLSFTNARYGVMPDDNFELIYAEVVNSANGKTYIYNNVDRTPLNFMADEDNVISLDLILQQQMEEQKLEEVRAKIVEEAKKRNVITDHTNITVDSRLEPDYDANGNKILNYIVNFSYEVEPGFTAHEDFAPGKYHSGQSPAANAMLSLVKEVLEGDFAPYVKAGKKLLVTISGTADSTPIVSRIVYDGAFGDIVEVPAYQNGTITSMTIHPNALITQNEELAFLRAYSVNDYLMKNIESLKDMNITPRYNVNVTEGKGSEFRRITLQLNFVDAL